MTSRRISVRLPGKMAQRLKERTHAAGKRESEIVRQALQEHLSKNGEERTAYDAFREAGLIGCATGLPEDLATNKKHFKGFGKTK